MDAVRIAVVGGGGGVGRHNHLPAISALPEAQLVAICDPDEQGLASATAEHGGDAYTDYDALLRREDIDLIDIASPDFLHARQAVSAAGAGKHVLCEKPMALNLQDAQAMRRAVDHAGVKFMVAQSVRWRPESIAFKEACGRVGEPAFTAYHLKGRFFPYPAASFYRTRESLGPFVHNGMHYVDLMSWCIESLPTRVYACSTRHYPTEDRLETDNYYTANVTYENGATGIYELNLLMLDPPGFPPEERWYVVGSEGTAEWRRDSSRRTEVFDDRGVSFPRKSWAGTEHDPFRGEIAHMCRCILRDEPPSISMPWSIRILAACLGVVESSQTGEVVALVD